MIQTLNSHIATAFLAMSMTFTAYAKAEPTTGPSIYDLDLQGESQDGKTTSLDKWRGHPVLITMFYSSCAYACPMIIKGIQSVERKLTAEELADLRVIMVSFDPKKDTPKRLAEVIGQYKLDDSRWTLLRVDANKARELAAVLGISYREVEGGDFNHTSKIVVLDKAGTIKFQTEDTGGAGRIIPTELRALAKKADGVSK